MASGIEKRDDRMQEKELRKIDMPFIFRGGKRYPLVHLETVMDVAPITGRITKSHDLMTFRHTQSGKEVEVVWENPEDD